MVIIRWERHLPMKVGNLWTVQRHKAPVYQEGKRFYVNLAFQHYGCSVECETNTDMCGPS